MRLSNPVAACLLALAGLVAAPASAVTFNLLDIGGAGAGTQARQGFQIATAYWSSVLTNDITLDLEIGFESLGGNILGQTGSNSQVAYASDVYRALSAGRTSAIDASVTSVGGLPVLKGADLAFDVRVNDFNDPVTPTGSPLDAAAVPQGGYTDARTRLDNDGSANNFVLAPNTANLKALGFTRDANGDPISSDPDGSVVFSSDFAFDFDPTDGITTGQSDFIAVAIHEIGHALGFVSGVDTYDIFSAPGSPVLGTLANGQDITYEEALRLGLIEPGEKNLENFAIGSVLDLFRYNANGELDWSTSSAPKLFSVNGGRSAVYGNGAFSLGSFNGDGNQASHWLQPADQSTREGACSNFLGIMNPYLCSGQVDAVSGLDLAAMDAIGWTLDKSVRDKAGYNFTTAQAFASFAPEPATWAEFVLGFGLMGLMVRRGRRRALA